MSIELVVDAVKLRHEIRNDTRGLKNSIKSQQEVLKDLANPDNSLVAVEIGESDGPIQEELSEAKQTAARIEASIEKLSSLRAELDVAKKKRKSSLTWLFIIIVIAAGGAGLYFSGMV